jgi:hypothetical protein
MRTKKAKTAAIFFIYIGGKMNTQTNDRIAQLIQFKITK